MSSTTRTTSESKPPEWSLEGYKELGGAAQDWYQSGAGGNVYEGSSVAPWSDTTMLGINQQANAGQNWNTAGSRPIYQGIGANAANDPTAGQFNSVYQNAQGPSSAEQNLQGYASGANLTGEGNPFYRARLESDLADTAAQVRSSMSGAGRYGSNVSNEMLATELGQQRNAALEQDWNREQANQFNAVGMIDAGRNANVGNQLAALTGAGQMALGNRGQMLDATNAISGLDQRNFQNSLAGADATLSAGRAIDQQSQAQLMDEISKFYEADNADLTRLGMYSSILGGASADYGQQRSTSRTSNPMGVIGGVGSALGGLKSDARLKRDISRIGQADNGLPIYLFRYRDAPEWHIGYMAQDVMKVNPSAVMVGEDGFFRVDYASASIQKEAA
jgi:hypothetical protein